MEEFVSIKELLDKQNKLDKKHTLYQIQSNKDDNFANIINIGEYSNIPLVPVYKFNLDIFKCEIISFVVLEEELYQKHIKMLSLIVSDIKSNKIIASLDYVFIADCKINMNTLNNLKGSFEIVLNMKKNNIPEYTTIKKFETYSGKEESIYLLTEVLLEENVINKIIEATYTKCDK